VPIHAEDYVHRIGRTGRAGRDGRAFTIATPEDGRFVSAISRLIGKDIPAVTLDGIGPAALSADGEGSRHRGRRDHRREDRRPQRDHRNNDGQASRHGHKNEPRGGSQRSHGRPPREMRRHDAPPPITMDPEGKVTPLPPREHRVDREDDRRVLGFGDHLPAFLARPRAARG
jgi:superfamily II DNA/RNA helicase